MLRYLLLPALMECKILIDLQCMTLMGEHLWEAQKNALLDKISF